MIKIHAHTHTYLKAPSHGLGQWEPGLEGNQELPHSLSWVGKVSGVCESMELGPLLLLFPALRLPFCHGPGAWLSHQCPGGLGPEADS